MWFDHRLAGPGSMIVLMAAIASFVHAESAEADCLVGPDKTGLEVGNQTLSVTPLNSSPFTSVFPPSCMESSGLVDPGATSGGTGQARFISNHLGYRGYTGAITGGDATGSGSAVALGSVRWLVRVTSLPGYSGPSAVDLELSMLFDVSGSIMVSGAASAGGSFNTDVTLKPADTQIGAVMLFNGNGALQGGTPTLLQATIPVDVDRDYELQISHNQSVQVVASSDPMGAGIGTAASSGTVAISFASALVVPSGDLVVEYPMVDLLGVPAPSLGNPPVFPPAAVPTTPRAGLLLLWAAVAWSASWGWSRRADSNR